MGIKKAQIQGKTRTILLLLDNKVKSLDDNAPYQRDYVWGVDRKRALIESIFDGTPIPNIILNDRAKGGFKEKGYNNVRNWAYGVVDGKQRIDAIRSFIDSEFTVPNEWFDYVEIQEEFRKKKELLYSELSLSSRRAFLQRFVMVAEIKVSSLAEEKKVFDRVNFSGLAQGDSDIK